MTDNVIDREKEAKYKEKMKGRSGKEHDLHVGDKVLPRQNKKNKLSTPFSTKEMTIVEVKGSSVAAQNDECSLFRDASQFRRVVSSDSDNDEVEPTVTPQPEPAAENETGAISIQPELEEPVVDTNNPSSPAGHPTVAERRSRRNVRTPAWCADYEM